MKYFIVLIFLSFISIKLLAQGEFNYTHEPDKYNINSYGVKLNTNGYGLLYSFSKRINNRNRFFIESEYNYQKSYKELKIINPYVETYSKRKFIFGKTFSVHNIKLGYGHNYMLFEKHDKNSLSIHLSASIGGILSLSKPIYYEIVDSFYYHNEKRYAYTSEHRFDEYKHKNPTDIAGRSSFFKGITETRPNAGIYLKLGLAFDFSQDLERTQVLELGALIDLYINQLEIMAEKRSRFYPALYIAYHFGKKYDPRINRDYRRQLKKE